MKKVMYIFAGGKSSRFGGNPKILETFDINKKILEKYFNIFIVTSKEIYKKTKHLEANFIIQDMGNGSGADVYNLFQKISSPAFVSWSDVFYTDESIQDIISASTKGKNVMTISYRENPYIDIVTKNNIIIDYVKEKDIGYQDNSLFYITELKYSKEEFMDMAIQNEFYTEITKNKTEYFNTLEELQALQEFKI
jgi:GTP:adenosylcobinamide-phosphate guanylyltransferase